MVSLKSTVSCGTMPMAARSDFLGDIADVLPVDQDAARRHVVEAEEQPRDRRFAGARRPDDGDRMAGRHLEG